MKVLEPIPFRIRHVLLLYSVSCIFFPAFETALLCYPSKNGVGEIVSPKVGYNVVPLLVGDAVGSWELVGDKLPSDTMSATSPLVGPMELDVSWLALLGGGLEDDDDSSWLALLGGALEDPVS